jgi:hypothetical protein
MAVKHRILSLDADLREGIPAGDLLELLGNHAFGKIDLTQSKVKACEILLKKCLPDIVAVTVDVTGGVQIEVLQVKAHAKPAPATKPPAKKRAVNKTASK